MCCGGGARLWSRARPRPRGGMELDGAERSGPHSPAAAVAQHYTLASGCIGRFVCKLRFYYVANDPPRIRTMLAWRARPAGLGIHLFANACR